MKLAPESQPALSALALLAVLLLITQPVWSLIPMAAAAALAYFFRDPDRSAPPLQEAILAPADGRVGRIQTGKSLRVPIHLSLLDVHVNRFPISGRVNRVSHSPGKFFPAFLGKAVLENENNLVAVEESGLEVRVRQIAGILARRIICYCREGDRVHRGERLGLIQFGSAVELELPAEAVELRVRTGQRVRAGETVMAVIRRKKSTP